MATLRKAIAASIVLWGIGAGQRAVRLVVAGYHARLDAVGGRRGGMVPVVVGAVGRSAVHPDHHRFEGRGGDRRSTVQLRGGDRCFGCSGTAERDFDGVVAIGMLVGLCDDPVHPDAQRDQSGAWRHLPVPVGPGVSTLMPGPHAGRRTDRQRRQASSGHGLRASGHRRRRSGRAGLSPPRHPHPRRSAALMRVELITIAERVAVWVMPWRRGRSEPGRNGAKPDLRAPPSLKRRPRRRRAEK